MPFVVPYWHVERTCVEDDERIRSAVKLALEDEGWTVDEAESGIPRSICDYRCSIGQIPPGRYQLLVGQVNHVLHKYRLSISGTHADKTMIATEGASMTFYASKCWTLAAERRKR